MIKDLFIPFSTYPDPVPPTAIGAAVRLAERVGAGITALAFDLDFHAPGNAIANRVLDLPGMVAAARERARANAAAATQTFEDACRNAGVAGDVLAYRCEESRVTEVVVECARLRDLTVVPAPETGVQQQWVAESVVFGSGRPILLLPAAAADVPLRTVAVAWDGTRPAARALADALPLLRLAETVRIFTVGGEKALPKMHGFDEIRRHLSRHGIEATCDLVDGAGRPIGETMAGYVASHGADLLVMGAYAHSRMRDFILGGATRSMVAAPPIPALLSH